MSHFPPAPLYRTGLLILMLATSMWWWPSGNEPGSVGQGSEATLAEASAAGVLGATRRITAARLTASSPRAPGLGPSEPNVQREPAAQPTGTVAPAPEEGTLIARLREQGVRMAAVNQLQSEVWGLPPDVSNQLSDSSTWLPELMKASSTIQNNARGEPTRLAVHDIEGDSLLWDLGLRDGDVIVLIDGEIPRFSATKAYDLVRKAQVALAALDRGEPISLTVLRQQRPVHLVYQALNQE